MGGSSNVQLLGLQVLWHKFLSLEKHTEYLLQTWVFESHSSVQAWKMEKIMKNTCVKTWVLKSKTPLQFLNGKNIRVYVSFKHVSFILSNNSKTHKEDSSKMWVFKSTGACEFLFKPKWSNMCQFFIKDNSILGFFSSCGHFKHINWSQGTIIQSNALLAKVH